MQVNSPVYLQPHPNSHPDSIRQQKDLCTLHNCFEETQIRNSAPTDFRNRLLSFGGKHRLISRRNKVHVAQRPDI